MAVMVIAALDLVGAFASPYRDFTLDGSNPTTI